MSEEIQVQGTETEAPPAAGPAVPTKKPCRPEADYHAEVFMKHQQSGKMSEEEREAFGKACLK